jgi:hypothetical protein
MRRFGMAVVTILIVMIFGTAAFAQKMKAEDVVAKNLDSIGTAEVRADLKTLIAVGPTKQRFTSTSDAAVDGRIVIASEAAKVFIGMNMASIQYPGQRFVFDGKNADVAMTSQTGRDFLGNFVKDNGPLLKSGILGGTLSTGWLLANDPSTKGKLTFEGIKKIEGRDAYVLQFSPKGGSDINILLYFDAESFRHIRSEYGRITSAPQGVMGKDLAGKAADNSGRQSETRIKVIEDFSDFRAEKSIMLPHAYKISYSYSGNQGTVQCEWMSTLTEFGVNQKFDPSTFALSGTRNNDD